MSRLKNILSNNWFVRKFKELDNWLLIHYPFIWQSQLHYYLLFSLAFGSPIMFGLGLLAVFYLHWSIMIIIIIMFVTVFLYPIKKLVAIPINTGSIKNYLSSLLYRALSATILFVNVLAFVSPTIILSFRPKALFLITNLIAISFLLVVAAFTLAFSLKSIYVAITSNITKLNENLTVIRKLKLLRKLDNYLLINYPYIWSIRLHVFTINFTILCISTTLVLYLIVGKELKLDSSIARVFFWCAILIWYKLRWLRRQSKIKITSNSIVSNLYMVVSFTIIANLFPVSLIFFVESLGFRGIQTITLAVVSFIVTIPFITFLISSKFSEEQKTIVYPSQNILISTLILTLFSHLIFFSEKISIIVFGILVLILLMHLFVEMDVNETAFVLKTYASLIPILFTISFSFWFIDNFCKSQRLNAKTLALKCSKLVMLKVNLFTVLNKLFLPSTTPEEIRSMK